MFCIVDTIVELPQCVGGASVKRRTDRSDETMKHFSGECEPMYLKVSLLWSGPQGTEVGTCDLRSQAVQLTKPNLVFGF